MDKLSSQLRHIQAKYGVFASLGNHDSVRRGAKEKVVQSFENVGISVMENRSLLLAEDRLTLVGLGDLWRGDFKPELAFRNVRTDLPALVMSHNPDTAEQLKHYRADIIFSGHTHGGTARIPLFGSVYPLFSSIVQNSPLWLRGLIPYSQHAKVVKNHSWVEGLHKLRRSNKDGTEQYNYLTVSRGVGSHPEGFRIFCEPEITLVTLTQL